MIRTATHPGPITPERQKITPAAGRPVTLTLAAGIPLETAVADALTAIGCDNSAYLELRDAPVTDLTYVMPAHAPDDSHAAWYSDMHRFGGPGVINHLGMIVGYREKRCFIHGHGTWTLHNKPLAMGHIISPQTVLTTPTIATGFALSGARFDEHADPETNFTLFSPAPHGDDTTTDADFALLRILPNQDFDTALDQACASLGWHSAQAWGVGSINTPHFDDGRIMDSLPTEFVVLDAHPRADGRAPLGTEIRIVGTGADQIAQGRLKRGHNGVLITAEIVLKRDN